MICTTQYVIIADNRPQDPSVQPSAVMGQGSSFTLHPHSNIQLLRPTVSREPSFPHRA